MEKACVFGANRDLIGILGEPDGNVAVANRPAVILVNGGLVSRVGPFRLYVDICRRLVEAGFLSFRFDPTGYGDSAAGTDGRSLHERVQHDVVAAMDYLSAAKGCREFVLTGLCSGADNAYYVAVRDRRVVGMVWIDGFAYRTLAYHIHHYLPRLFDARRWAHLASRLVSGARTRKPRAEDDENLRDFPTIETLRRELRGMTDAGMRLLLIFTGGMNKYYSHKGQLLRTCGPLGNAGNVTEDFYPAFDHIFTLMEDRATVVERIGQWMSVQFGSARAADEVPGDATRSPAVSQVRDYAAGRA